MLAVPERITGLSHPLIREAYLKKGMTQNGHKEENVLVLDTFNPEPDDDHDNFDAYLIDLMTDLPGIRNEIEEKTGHVDRIDIRRH